MLEIIRYQELGQLELSWLSARYHFSFSSYYNPNRVGFGSLRVINDDIVRIGGGFGMHSHNDMEIITYVRTGAIAHRDSLGNAGKTSAGDVQVMSAGSGISHSEYNEETMDTNLYQIWIEPNQRGVTPRWEARAFDKNPVQTQLNLMVSGLPEHAGAQALFIHADAAVYGGVLAAGSELVHPLPHGQKGGAYLLVSSGSVTVENEQLSKGDAAQISGQDALRISSAGGCEIVVIELASLTPNT